MASQNEINTATPYSGMIVTISEIIAPAVVSIATGLIFLGRKTVALFTRKQVKNLQSPAPHVAMIMVPGNFVVGAFTNH